jgi:hypothetical protein
MVGRHKLDAALAMALVLPIHDRSYPKAAFLPVGKMLIRVVMLIFRSPEQGFAVILGDNKVRAYVPHSCAIACRTRGFRHIHTRPYTPRTNGKVARFIQTLCNGWAYAIAYLLVPAGCSADKEV